MTDEFDKRLYPYRDDLAAKYLEGQVKSKAFVEGAEHQVITGATNLRETPDKDGPKGKRESQLLFGEVFTVYEEKDGWSWGQNKSDGYVGYVETAGLSSKTHEPTHQVGVLETHIYPTAGIKSVPLGQLYLSSTVCVDGEEENGFLPLASGGWVFAKHLVSIDEKFLDFVETAILFWGAPYLWGGKTAGGIDCSALVQIALKMSDVVALRDTDMQQARLEAVDVLVANDTKPQNLQRGDIVFFPGHVGIMVDEENLLHANARNMAVTMDPVEEVAENIKETDKKGITAVKRLVDPDQDNE